MDLCNGSGRAKSPMIREQRCDSKARVMVAGHPFESRHLNGAGRDWLDSTVHGGAQESQSKHGVFHSLWAETLWWTDGSMGTLVHLSQCVSICLQPPSLSNCRNTAEESY